MKKTVQKAAPRERKPLDDTGCIALADAVTMQAAKDYLTALAGKPTRARAEAHRRELEHFFRSAFFRQLSGLDGEKVMELIRREVRLK